MLENTPREIFTTARERMNKFVQERKREKGREKKSTKKIWATLECRHKCELGKDRKKEENEACDLTLACAIVINCN